VLPLVDCFAADRAASSRFAVSCSARKVASLMSATSSARSSLSLSISSL
jgi:hypothetical protein